MVHYQVAYNNDQLYIYIYPNYYDPFCFITPVYIERRQTKQ